MTNEERKNEESETRRPNANYKLSNVQRGETVDGEEQLVFYYNREERLAKAPQAVRDLYKPRKNYSRFNLIRPLVADKPRAMVFSSIIILCIAIFLLSKLGYFDDTHAFDGNRLEISASVFEGTTIVVLKKTVKDKTSAYTGIVDIAVSPVMKGEDEEMFVFYHRVFFTMEPVEEYRFAAPYDSPDQMLVLQSEKSTLKINLKPK